MDKLSMQILAEAIKNLRAFQTQNAELDAEYARSRSVEGVIARLGMEARDSVTDAGRQRTDSEGPGSAQSGSTPSPQDSG